MGEPPYGGRCRPAQRDNDAICGETPSGGGTSAGHTSGRGVPLEPPRSSARAVASGRRAAEAGRRPSRRGRPDGGGGSWRTAGRPSVLPPPTVAPPRSDPGKRIALRRGLQSCDGRPCGRPPPSGTVVTPFSVVALVGSQPTAWSGRESNP